MFSLFKKNIQVSIAFSISTLFGQTNKQINQTLQIPEMCSSMKIKNFTFHFGILAKCLMDIFWMDSNGLMFIGPLLSGMFVCNI